MIIEIGVVGFVYGVSKDIYGWFKQKNIDPKEEEPKLVSNAWLEKSGLLEKLKGEGLTASWSNPNKVEERLLDGYEIIYEIDENAGIKRRLVLRGGPTLMGKIDFDN